MTNREVPITAQYILNQLAGLGLRPYGICGEVYLWGTVIEHRSGWRAQFAYPKSFVLSSLKQLFPDRSLLPGVPLDPPGSGP